MRHRPFRIPDHPVAHAYLLEGGDPDRLYEAAKQFALRLLSAPGRRQDGAERDPGGGGHGSGRDSVAVRVDNRSHPDLILLSPDKPEDNPHILSVDNIRRNLADTVGVRPYEAEYKVYIILQADGMNVQAQNALLKTLEEPPPYVVILLLCANASAFLPTVLSRVLSLQDREKDAGELFQTLFQMPWAERCLSMVAAGEGCSRKDVLAFSREMSDQKVPMQDLLSFLGILLRDAMCYKYTGNGEFLYGQECADRISMLAARLESRQLGELEEALSEARRGLSLNVNRELQLENLLFLFRRGRGQGEQQ